MGKAIPMVTKLMIVAFFLIVASASFDADSSAAPGSESHAVPERYQRTYDILKLAMEDFDRYLNAMPRPTPTHRPVFASDLSVASGSRGKDLLGSSALPGVKLQLDRFQKLGLNGVTVSVGYQLLMSDFPEHDKYAEFYRQVAQEVHQRNLTLDVELSGLFANTPFVSNLPPYPYRGRTFAQYEADIRLIAQKVIDSMQPDYLNIGSEPDVEAGITGIKDFVDPVCNAQFVQYVLTGLKKGSTKVASGMGSWSDLKYAKELSKVKELDCIDLHIYPAYSASQLTQTVAVADIAKKHGKGFIIDEAWLSKTIGGEPSAASNPDVFKRDVYSFWAPLDQLFIANLAKLAEIKGATFISPFWSQYLFAYLDYAPTLDRHPYAVVNALLAKQELDALLRGTFSPTGFFYRNLIESKR